MSYVLIADIGGTNARFALTDSAGVHGAATLKVADYPGPVEAARAYLVQTGKVPDRAVFAVAAPVTGEDVFALTNFPWTFSIDAARKALGLSALGLINDFHAQALGVIDADPARVTQIGGGRAQAQGNIGIIGPGTGLGVAALAWDSRAGRYIALPGEGGHVTIPTLDPREFAVINWLLQNRYSHVSAERVCSGKGLVNIYEALRGIDRFNLPDLGPEDISANALNQTCRTCGEALSMMLTFLGRVGGNLALTLGANAGVYFTGGILPRLNMDYLRASNLRPAFIAKGRQTAYVDQIPTFLVDDPLLPLRGLRAYAFGQG